MRIAIADDEEAMCQQLSQYAAQYSAENGLNAQIDCYRSGEALLRAAETAEQPFDLVFLDIEMAQLDGMETARRLRERDSRFVLIFVTNMAQYAIQGYEVDALDFVLKPVTYASFSFRMKKALRRISSAAETLLTLKLPEGTKLLSSSRITYVEVYAHYLLYHTPEAAYEVRGTMRDAQKQLEGSNFVRTGNSYLVNLQYVEEVGKTQVRVAGVDLPLSRNRKAEFMQRLALYVGGNGAS